MPERYWIPEHRGSRVGWPVLGVPVTALIGMTTDEATRVCTAAGFFAEVFDEDIHGGWDANLCPGRIRLRVHHGLVMNASQG